MEWNKISVLVLDSSSRQILPILKELNGLKCSSTILYHSKWDNAYASRYPTQKVRIISYSEEQYLQAIIDELRRQRYDAILPLSDYSMDLITKNLGLVSQYVGTPIPNRETFLKAYDKQKTMEICMDNNIPCTITKRNNEDLNEFLDRVGFPIVAKPRMANGSKGLKIVKSQEQLSDLINRGEIVLEDYVIQEFVPQTGKQFNIHLFRDDEGKICSNLVTEKARWFPVDGGASCLCRTAWNQTIGDNCEKLLNAVGWRSYCEIEMIVDPRDGIAKVLEINGRASASIKIMDLAGMNVAKQMLQLSLGEPVEFYSRAKDDIRLRCILTDVLWLIQSKDRFSRKPNWFSPIRTHDALFSVSDPIPFFTYSLSMIPRLKSEMKKRKRN